MSETTIILGAGHAGVSTAVNLRGRGYEGRILVLDPTTHVSYERPHLSKDMLKPDGPATGVPLRKPAYLDSKEIERLAGVSVASIDLAGHTVVLEDGRELVWDDLVFATGSVTRDLPTPGGRLPGHLRLKTLDDALAVKERLTDGVRVVVIGAGYIGLEVAAAAAKLGCTVTVLEFADRVMSRVTSEPVSRFFQKVHEEHGVSFSFGQAVTAVEGDGRVERVVTARGDVFEADVVIEGIGILPNSRLAQEAGIPCEDGILVDGDGATSVPHVYAAGDVTRFPSAYDGSSQRLECIANALEQADRVASRITGTEPAPREVPWFWTIQHGVRLQTAGVLRPDDTVVVRGDPDSGHFSVCYVREGRLAAIDTVGGLKDFRAGRKLIAARSTVDAERLADPSIPLSDVAHPDDPGAAA